jgi:hypothetical protein
MGYQLKDDNLKGIELTDNEFTNTKEQLDKIIKYAKWLYEELSIYSPQFKLDNADLITNAKESCELLYINIENSYNNKTFTNLINKRDYLNFQNNKPKLKNISNSTSNSTSTENTYSVPKLNLKDMSPHELSNLVLESLDDIEFYKRRDDSYKYTEKTTTIKLQGLNILAETTGKNKHHVRKTNRNYYFEESGLFYVAGGLTCMLYPAVFNNKIQKWK